MAERALLVIAVSLATTTVTIADDGLPFGREEPRVPAAAPTKQPGPLEKLKLRSARDRWLKLREEIKQSDDVVAPAERDTPEVAPPRREARRKPVLRLNPFKRDKVEQKNPVASEPDGGTLPPRPRDVDALLKRYSPSENEGQFVYPPQRRIAQEPEVQASPQVDQQDPPAETSSELKKITEIRPYLSYATEGIDPDLVPEDPTSAIATQAYQHRAMPRTLFQWKASNIRYNPLYFEDGPLERYGHTHNKYIQPVVSAGKFTVQLVGLPYQMVLKNPRRCEYPLGWYRPGECAPKKHYQIPLSRQAAMVQAGVMTGWFFLIP